MNKISPDLFKNVSVRCEICGSTQYLTGNEQSEWRCLEVNKTKHYVCPKHFPADGSSVEEYQKAYLKIFRKIGVR